MARRYTISVLIEGKDKLSSVMNSIATGAMERLGHKVTDLIQQLPQMAIEMVELGARAETAQNRFVKFAGGAEEAAALLEAFQDAADGTVPRLDAMSSAARLLQMGLVGNAEEMELMTAIAVKLGNQTMTAGDRIADFSMLLANQAVRRLDNFGMSSGKVRERVNELTESIEGLSREEAFKIAVMEEGRKALGILGDTSGLAQTKIDKLKAAVEDAKVSIGEMAVEALGAVDDFDAFTESIRTAPERLFATVKQLSILADSALTAAEAFLKGEDATAAFDHALKTGTMTTKTYLDTIPQVEGAIDGWMMATQAATIDTEELSDTLKELTSTTHDTTVSLETLIASFNWPPDWNTNQAKASQLAKDHAASLFELSQSLMDVTAAQAAEMAISQLNIAFEMGKITTNEYRSAVANLQLTYGLATQESIMLSENMMALADQLAMGYISLEEYNVGITALLDTIPPTTSEIEQLSLETERLAREAEAAAAMTGDIFVEALALATEETDFMSMALFQAADAAGADADTLLDLANTLGLYTDVELEAAIATVVLRTALDDLGEAVATGKMTMEDAMTALQDLIISMPTATDLMQRQSRVTHRVTMNRQRMTQADREAAAAERDLARAMAHTGDVFMDFLPTAAEDADAWAMSLLNAADAAGASAEALALLGGALGIYSEEQVEAALASAALQIKIEELGAAIAAETMGYEAAIEQLMQFKEQFLPLIAASEEAATGGNGDVTNNNFSMTVNTGADSSSVIQDYEVLQALANV